MWLLLSTKNQILTYCIGIVKTIHWINYIETKKINLFNLYKYALNQTLLKVVYTGKKKKKKKTRKRKKDR